MLGESWSLTANPMSEFTNWWLVSAIPARSMSLQLTTSGSWSIDRLAERNGIEVGRKDSRALVGQGTVAGKKVLLAKPQTYMNLSGQSVQGLLVKNEIAPADLILVYDELDLPWQSVRIRPNGSAAGHRGMDSVIALRWDQRVPPGSPGSSWGPSREGRRSNCAREVEAGA